MLKYHAKIAADLDGGSSTTMVYNNKLVNTPVDLTGARSVGTSIVVMPQDGGE
jgi:exopolysaccharide biosynthesis protein